MNIHNIKNTIRKPRIGYLILENLYQKKNIKKSMVFILDLINPTANTLEPS